MRTTYITIGVLILLVIGGFVLAQNGVLNFGDKVADNESNINPPPPAPAGGTTTPPPPAATSVIVKYTNSGYVPADVTIKKGQSVTWINESTKNMWVASAIHPTHAVYAGTDLAQHCPDASNNAFDECKGDAPGSTYTFTFNKVGVWRYHDHIDATKFGKVTVTE